MNREGFTLIELVAIIVVLAAIFLVSFPAFSNIARSDQEKEYNDMVNNLCLAGKTYIYSDMSSYPLSTVGSIININISSLIDYGNVDPNTKDPKTGSTVTNSTLSYKVLSDLSLDCSYNG